jgi:DNA gyrase subunit A
MSSSGTLVRVRASEISVMGRNTQGVRLIRLDDGERLIGVEAVTAEDEVGEIADAGLVDPDKTEELPTLP